MVAPPKYEVRAYRPTDADALRKIAGASFTDFGAFENTVTHWVQQQSTVTIVASAQSDLIGFVVYGYRDTEDGIFGEIIALATAETHRRQGVGERLLNTALSYLNAGADAVDAVGIRLHVASSNTEGRALFSRCGFREVRSDGMYPSRQPAILCVLGLKRRNPTVDTETPSDTGSV